eukprot:1495980-Pyramimonas_sp.AAC.1
MGCRRGKSWGCLRWRPKSSTHAAAVPTSAVPIWLSSALMTASMAIAHTVSERRQPWATPPASGQL